MKRLYLSLTFFTALLIIGCSEEPTDMMDAVIQEPVDIILAGEMKKTAVLETTAPAAPTAPKKNAQKQDNTPPTVRTRLTFYENPNGDDLVDLWLFADEALAMKASRVRFTIAGKQYGKAVTPVFIKAEDDTYTYAASFKVNAYTPAGVVGFAVTPKDTAGNAATKITQATQTGSPVVIEPPPFVVTTALLKSGERGSDVRLGETVTLELTANRKIAGEFVHFFVNGVPEGRRVKISQKAKHTYRAAFTVRKPTPAGAITVRFRGKDLETPQKLWVLKTHPPPPPHVDVPAVYTQWVDAHGFPIVATDAVNPRALDEAAWIMENMTTPNYLRKLGEANGYFVILEYTESVQTFFNRSLGGETIERDRLVGRGTTAHNNTTLTGFAGEENVLNYEYAVSPGTHNSLASTTVHELAHFIHHKLLGEDFDTRLRQAYEAAKRNGLWKDSYAISNHREYFAEGTTIWFGENIPWFRQYVGTSRQDLREYDENLADLVEEVFGDRPWRWKPVRDRLHLPHLDGYDPIITPQYDVNIFDN